MFANLYIYFICLKLFVKKVQINLNWALGSKSSPQLPLKQQQCRFPHQILHLLKNQKVAPIKLEHPPNYLKKYYLNHFKEVFPEKRHFTTKLPHKAPKLFAKTSSKSGFLLVVATPCNTSITIPKAIVNIIIFPNTFPRAIFLIPNSLKDKQAKIINPK